MSVKKQTFTMELTNSVIQEILQNSGGTINLSTSLYPDLNSVDTQYWKFHSPFGYPGDELIITEDYAIREVSQTTKGFFVVIEYKDGTKIKKKSQVPNAVTPCGTWLKANTMPVCFSRCKVLIQDIQMAVDNSCWMYVVSLLNLPKIDLDWNLEATSNICCE